MIPVDQRVFTDGGLGLDCWRACVASILELPYEEVPDLLGGADQYKEQMDLTREFLSSRGLVIKTGWVSHLSKIPKGAYFIGSGVSPRSPIGKVVWHAVVCKLDSRGLVRVAHDPHPSRAGVVGDCHYYYWIESNSK